MLKNYFFFFGKSYIKIISVQMFNAAKKIAELFDSYHLNTTFLLVTYSSPEKTALHNDNGPETLSKFAERIDNLMNNTDLLLPYFDGSTYLSR